MNYTKTAPCSDCPFLVGTEHAFTNQRLRDFASGPFPCHKTADVQDGSFTATKKSVHCAGALIYQEKRNTPNQMTRIAEGLGMYDRTQLNMESPIR